MYRDQQMEEITTASLKMGGKDEYTDVSGCMNGEGGVWRTGIAIMNSVRLRALKTAAQALEHYELWRDYRTDWRRTGECREQVAYDADHSCHPCHR